MTIFSADLPNSRKKAVKNMAAPGRCLHLRDGCGGEMVGTGNINLASSVIWTPLSSVCHSSSRTMPYAARLLLLCHQATHTVQATAMAMVYTWKCSSENKKVPSLCLGTEAFLKTKKL
jgi:hypothetical protein